MAGVREAWMPDPIRPTRTDWAEAYCAAKPDLPMLPLPVSADWKQTVPAGSMGSARRMPSVGMTMTSLLVIRRLNRSGFLILARNRGISLLDCLLSPGDGINV